MEDNEHPGELPVSVTPVNEKESGQKLLRLLDRRLGLPEALLHRWIRTGQIRVNGKRCKPFDRVRTGDILRLPPFAGAMAAEALESSEGQGNDSGAKDAFCCDISLSFLESWRGILAIYKPAGLPVQPGTGHGDSVSARLASRNNFFNPVPAHRLDRDTSGVLLAGESYEALRYLQDSFREGKIHKEYLAWVQGRWSWSDVFLRHYLRREKSDGKTKTRVYPQPVPYAREALGIVHCLAAGDERSLLQIRLLTGRTHQIRAQLAYCGHPVAGDVKYGLPGPFSILYLHAMRIILPDGHEFSCMPDWSGKFTISQLPPPLPDNLDCN